MKQRLKQLQKASKKSGTKLAVPTGFQALLTGMVVLAAVVITVLPFHAFLTVWGASLVGHYTALRLWKEAIVALLGIGAVVLLAANYRRPGSRLLLERQRIIADMRRHPLVVLGLVYVGLLLGDGAAALAAHQVTAKAFAFGLLLDGRFLVFFLVVWLISHYNGLIVRHWRQLLLIPASVVIVFGLLQFTLLPSDFLSHFGYNHTTIDAVQTIDQKASYQRVQSTLRGANPLGAYLVPVLTAAGALLLRAGDRSSKASQRRFGVYGGLFGVGCAVLAMTFSRSAWIGALAAFGYLVWQGLAQLRARRLLLTIGCVALLAFGVTGYMLRTNDVVQNTLFHTDEHSRSLGSSNQGHFTATVQGLHDIIHQPLGQGTGTAGPASVYNTGPGKGGARIAENYYVQVGQEVGIIGMVLFVAINGLVAWELWKRRHQILPQVLLASLLGISLINLLSHAWADDTLCYIWWGLAGAALSLPTAVGQPASQPGGSDEA